MRPCPVACVLGFSPIREPVVELVPGRAFWFDALPCGFKLPPDIELPWLVAEGWVVAEVPPFFGCVATLSELFRPGPPPPPPLPPDWARAGTTASAKPLAQRIRVIRFMEKTFVR